jgi:hypothetical protein
MQELRKQGVHVSQKKVDRTMSEEGLRSITVREQAIFEYMECFYNRKKVIQPLAMYRHVNLKTYYANQRKVAA